jgi:septation ring formation regulator EzrA
MGLELIMFVVVLILVIFIGTGYFVRKQRRKKGFKGADTGKTKKLYDKKDR